MDDPRPEDKAANGAADLDDLVTLDSEPAVMRSISGLEPALRQVYADPWRERM